MMLWKFEETISKLAEEMVVMISLKKKMSSQKDTIREHHKPSSISQKVVTTASFWEHH